jgi:hypothetical protein
LYGFDYSSEELGLESQPFYYFYTAMTWDNGSEEVDVYEGNGRGLFFRNSVDDSLEGWWCLRDSSNRFNYSCSSAKIDKFFFEEDSTTFPMQRNDTSWWECGAEDKKTYTQA